MLVQSVGYYNLLIIDTIFSKERSKDTLNKFSGCHKITYNRKR